MKIIITGSLGHISKPLTEETSAILQQVTQDKDKGFAFGIQAVVQLTLGPGASAQLGMRWDRGILYPQHWIR
jgi:hypothetical protein